MTALKSLVLVFTSLSPRNLKVEALEKLQKSSKKFRNIDLHFQSVRPAPKAFGLRERLRTGCPRAAQATCLCSGTCGGCRMFLLRAIVDDTVRSFEPKNVS